MAAEGDDQHRHDAHAELQAGLVHRHGPVIAPLGPPEPGIGPLELVDLGGLVGEGLGGAHAGDGGLQLPVDAGHLPLDLRRGVHHPPALEDGEEEKQRHHGKDHEGQLPPDGEHDQKGARQGDGGDEQVLGAVVGQLGDLEQVGGDPAHERTGAVLVVEGEGQILHVGEEGGADVRLDAYPQQVAPVGDGEVKDPLEQVGQQQGGHHGEEQAEQPLGQHVLHGVPGDQRKGQIHQRDAQRAEHVQQEEGQVGLIIRGEDAQIAAFPHLFRGHEDPPFKCKDVSVF